MSTQSSAAAVLDGLDDARGWMEYFYRTLHQHPELSHQEQQTAAEVAERLGEAGYEVTRGSAGPVWSACCATGPDRRCCCAPTWTRCRSRRHRAGVRQHRDRDGRGRHRGAGDARVRARRPRHLPARGCRVAAQPPDQWTGMLVVLFQPARRSATGPGGCSTTGSRTVVGEWTSRSPSTCCPMPAGVVGTRAGAVLSAADSMRVTVHGRGAHGSMPQAAVDPVVLAAMIVVRLQTVVSREIAPTEPAVADRRQHPVRHEEQRDRRPRRPRAERPHLRRADPDHRARRHPADRHRRVPGVRVAGASPSSSCSTGSRPPSTTPRRPDESRQRSPTTSASARRSCRCRARARTSATSPTPSACPTPTGESAASTPTPTARPSTRVGSPRTSPSTTPPSSPPSCSRRSTPAPKRSWSPPSPTWPGTTGLDEQPAGGPSTCRRHPAFPASSTIVPGRHG